MPYVLLFLEGVITFISPCLLPLLPAYVSYFAGGSGKVNALKNAVGFVMGFSLIFMALGAFAGSIGRALRDYGPAVDLVTGLIVVLFGLSYLGVWDVPFLNRSVRHKTGVREPGFFSSVLLGVVFSISWTPCVGAFLGSALMLASRQGSAARGMLMLATFSMGLGVPFIASAVLIGRLKDAFGFIKRNYGIINKVSGGLLVLVGVLMMSGFMGYFLSRMADFV